MRHYDITIINASKKDLNLAQKLKDKCKVLLVEKYSSIKTYYRNHIKTDNGYIVILYENKKNIQIHTEVLLDMDKAV
ncbi:hypothetical protein ACMC56_11775 [Campylobacterota bacterium DY0563]